MVNDSDELRIEDMAGVRHLVFNRPDKLNVLNLAQHDRVMTALEQAAKEPSVRVVVFSGTGRAFCAGDDLTGARTLPERWAGRSVNLSIGMGPVGLLDVCALIRKFPKPTVALMHGHALGSGYDYSLSCDFRVVTEDVNYGDPRIHRAMWAAEGWSYKLPRQLNQSAVTPIAYLGETLNGLDALACGLAHRCYGKGVDLRVEAQPFLEQLSMLDPTAYGTSKRRLLSGLDRGFDGA